METNTAAAEIAARRIEILRANGEDVRNTPAWKDALYERWMITEMAYEAEIGTAFVESEWE